MTQTDMRTMADARVTDVEIRKFADWINSRRYDICRDVMVTHLSPPSFVSRLSKEERLYAALTLVEPRKTVDA